MKAAQLADRGLCPVRLPHAALIGTAGTPAGPSSIRLALRAPYQGSSGPPAVVDLGGHSGILQPLLRCLVRAAYSGGLA